MKILKLVLGFFLLVFSVQAQVYFGLKGGLNQSIQNVDIRNISFMRTDYLTGANAGLAADFGLNDYLSLKTELFLSQKGYTNIKYLTEALFQTGNRQFSNQHTQIRNYLQMPVLLNFFYEGRKFKIFASPGIYTAFLMSARSIDVMYINDLGDQTNPPKIKTVDDEYVLKTNVGPNQRSDTRFDFGLSAGAGAGYKIKNGWLLIEGRFSQGLIDVNTFAKEYPLNQSVVLNSNWEITIGYVITLKPKKVKIIKPEPEENEETESNEN